MKLASIAVSILVLLATGSQTADTMNTEKVLPNFRDCEETSMPRDIEGGDRAEKRELAGKQADVPVEPASIKRLNCWYQGSKYLMYVSWSGATNIPGPYQLEIEPMEEKLNDRPQSLKTIEVPQYTDRSVVFAVPQELLDIYKQRIYITLYGSKQFIAGLQDVILKDVCHIHENDEDDDFPNQKFRRTRTV